MPESLLIVLIVTTCLLMGVVAHLFQQVQIVRKIASDQSNFNGRITHWTQMAGQRFDNIEHLTGIVVTANSDPELHDVMMRAMRDGEAVAFLNEDGEWVLS